jgi:acetolactate decarboxylase
MKGVNTPGYHLHYISSDRKNGGHILDFTSPGTSLTVKLDQTPGFYMVVPATGDFTGMNLENDLSSDFMSVGHPS